MRPETIVTTSDLPPPPTSRQLRQNRGNAPSPFLHEDHYTTSSPQYPQDADMYARNGRRRRYNRHQRLAFTFYILDAIIGIPFLTLILMRTIHWDMNMEKHVFLHGYFDAWLPWAIVTILIGLMKTGLSVWKPDIFGQRAMTSVSLFVGLLTVIFGMLFTGMWAQVHDGIGCDNDGDVHGPGATALPGSNHTQFR